MMWQPAVDTATASNAAWLGTLNRQQHEMGVHGAGGVSAEMLIPV